MNIETERKIKFWITTIVKILIGVWVLFKISAFVFHKKENLKAPVKTSKKELEKKEDTVLINKTDEVELPLIVNTKKDDKIILDKKRTSNEIKKTIGIFVLGKDLQLNNKVKFKLENQVFKDYDVFNNVISGNSINQDVLEDNLKSGNLSILENVSHVCIGQVNHTFRTGDNHPDIIICSLDLNYTVYTKSGISLPDLSKSDLYTGQGFTKQEALNNAIKQIK